MEPLLETDLSRNPSIRRLQHLLDNVLSAEFNDIIKRRDQVYEKVSQQVQFQKLIEQDLRLVEQPQQQQQHQQIEILHDVGCKFYTKCKLIDPRVIHVNVGCGIIVAMTIPEALAHSKRAEESYRQRSNELSRKALNSKYKMRLVMEAIMRLQDNQIASDVAKPRK